MDSPLFAKNFIAAYTLTAMKGLYREIVKNPYAGYPRTAALMTLLAICGAGAWILKQMSQGKTPPKVDTPRRIATLAYHGAVTGGSMGIFDSVMNPTDVTGYGRGVLEAMAGPVAGLPIGLYEEGIRLASEASSPKGLRRPLSETLQEEFIKGLRTSVPILSTHWATRAALNCMALDQWQFMADPHSHSKIRKMERKMQEGTGQTFWWEPEPGITPSFMR